jgi:hypothetical protein
MKTGAAAKVFHIRSSGSNHIVTWQLKGQNNGARRNCPLLAKGSKTLFATKDPQATIELLETVFLCGQCRGPEHDCAAEDQEQLQTTRPLVIEDAPLQ